MPARAAPRAGDTGAGQHNRAAPYFDEDGHQTRQSNQLFGTASTSRSATYSRTSSSRQGHQTISSRPNQAAGHQMVSNYTSYAAGFQRSRKGNLTVLLLRQLRRKTLTAEEATKKSRPGARARVGTAARTWRNPARQCGMALLYQMPLRGFPSQGQQQLPGQFSPGPHFASKGQNHQLWQHQEKSTHPSFQCLKCSQAILWTGARAFAPFTKKKGQPGTLKAICQTVPSLQQWQCENIKC